MFACFKVFRLILLGDTFFRPSRESLISEEEASQPSQSFEIDYGMGRHSYCGRRNSGLCPRQ